MPLTIRTSLVLLFFLILPSVAVPVSAQDDEQFASIAREMEAIRSLQLVDPLDLRFITRQEFQEEIAGDFLVPASDQEAADTHRVLVAFGYLDADQDMNALLIGLLGDQVAGYYDPDTGEMVVIQSGGGTGGMTAMEEVTLAHETVHALQDQNFNLATYNEQRLDGTDDASLAVTALIEGDATLSEIDYLWQDTSLARRYLSEIHALDGGDALDGVPPFLIGSLSFPYNEGFLFAQALYDEGGWDLLNAAYDNPPTTTEHILHPDKYLAGEEGVDVMLPELAAAVGPDWRTIDDNTLGEYLISILLGDAPLSDDQQERAHEGWGGDRYVALTDNTGTALAWVTAWDSEADAGEFLRAMIAREAERFDGEATEIAGVTTIQGDGVTVQLVQEGDTVTYLLGPDADTIAAVGEALAQDG